MTTHDTIQMLREEAQDATRGESRLRRASVRQARFLAAMIENLTGCYSRRQRLAVLRRIFCFGLASLPITTTYALSRAQAAVMIEFLFGLDRFGDLPAEPCVTAEARQFLEALYADESGAPAPQAEPALAVG